MMRRFLAPAALALLVVVLSACSGGSTLGGDGGASEGGGTPTSQVSGEGGASSEAGTVCTPGAYVFCRCSDRSEGTKACRADGLSFDACAPCP